MQKDLEALVAIPSITEDRAACRRALDYILRRAEEMGMPCRALCDHEIGEIEIGEGDEVVGLLAHTDVVPPGVSENWETEPFVPAVKDGCMYGRGVQDDKGPLIASLYSMKALLEDGRPFRKKVRMIIGTREETDWTDIHRYLKEHAPPDYGFTPDGDFPICNIEKGILEMFITLPFPAEDDGGWHIAAIDCGNMKNTVPGRATARMIRGGEVRSFEGAGASIHSGEPEKGENALLRMIAGMLADPGAAEMSVSSRRLLEFISEKFRDVYGNPLDIASLSEYYQGEYVEKNTISLNCIDKLSAGIRLMVDIRYTCASDPDVIAQTIRQQIKAIGGSAEVTDHIPPAFVRSDSPFIRILQRSYEAVTGQPALCKASTGGTYAQAMPNVVTFGPVFPGERDTCHEENEHMPLKRLTELKQIYTRALSELAFGSKSLK